MNRITLDLFKTVVWKISLWSVVAFGSVLCLYLVPVFGLITYGTIETKLTRLELPGGAYFAPASLFPHPNPWIAEIALFHADGRMLTGPDTEQICVGERFVLVRPAPPADYYLYEAGADDVMMLGDPGYSELWNSLESGDGLACNGSGMGWSHYAELLEGGSVARARLIWPWSAN